MIQIILILALALGLILALKGAGSSFQFWGISYRSIDPFWILIAIVMICVIIISLRGRK